MKNKTGIKEELGKLNHELDFSFIEEMSKRMSLNKSKYPPYNWKSPIDKEKLKQALFRHVLSIMQNNYKDEDQQFGHLSAAACNLMMLMYQLKNYEESVVNFEGVEAKTEKEEDELEKLREENYNLKRKIRLLEINIDALKNTIHSPKTIGNPFTSPFEYEKYFDPHTKTIL